VYLREGETEKGPRSGGMTLTGRQSLCIPPAS